MPGSSVPAVRAAVALASAEYEPRSPGTTVLYEIVRDHLETFRAHAAQLRDGEGLPAFVERAFRDFLQCGWLAGGFARFRCGACGLDRLVAFSCKGRALCPSCGGRRMAERAAHLVDQVLPDVPVRQWVLSLPHRLRYLLAWDHDLCRAVAAAFAQAVFRQLRDRARHAGIRDGRAGGVIVIQRFGGALNLNLHFHALILDGVFAPIDGGALAFHALAQRDDGERRQAGPFEEDSGGKPAHCPVLRGDRLKVHTLAWRRSTGSRSQWRARRGPVTI